MTDSLLAVFGKVAVSLAVGLMVGFERGWQQRDVEEGQRVAGLRTFGVIGLAGGVCGLAADELGAIILAFGLLAIAAMLIAAHFLSTRESHEYGITSEIAAFTTFGFGAVATIGFPAVAAAGAVVIAMLLGLKPELHRWLERLDRDELISALQLLMISVVVLPLLPNRGLGPWDAINPYHLWWLVVLVAGISFVGHFAVRMLGEKRGVLLTGLFGGMASTTALTLSFARAARKKSSNHQLLAVGVLISAATLFPRILVVLGIVNPTLLRPLVLPLVGMTVAGLAVALLIWLTVRRRAVAAAVATGPPFRLRTTLKFALVLVAIVILSEAAHQFLGRLGVYVLSAVSGLVSVNAIMLSLARMAGAGSLDPGIAINGIVLAAIINTLSKAAITGMISRGRLALLVAVGVVAIIAAGVGVLILG